MPVFIVQLIGFALKHWSWFAMAGLVLALGIDHARLNHAKADQWDRSMCQAGQACKPVKWEAEAKSNGQALRKSQDALQAAIVSNSNLTTAIAQQNASLDALKAQSDARVALANAKVRSAQALTAEAQKAAAAVLAAKPSGDGCKSAEELIDRSLN